MPRLTGSSFHKPTPFEFPRALPSPPDTTADVVEPAHVSASALLSTGHEPRSSEAELSAYSAPIPERPELPGVRFHRTSSIVYHTSGLRESRERAPQKGSKAFVIVVPPPSFSQKHGQLGHTLSTGPPHRLSQGLLMPLFPTMYSQLAAIAREYNFPSTAGLCLYPHFTDNGATMTPRISDESWPLFWSHVFESFSALRSPVNGKIEFDIDLRQARWYASWMASSHRDYTNHTPVSNPSVTPIAPERGESSTGLLDDDQESHSITPSARHIPRKLSLVDRFDLTSTHSGSRSASHVPLSPPRHVQVQSQVLSPIFQEEEPKSARIGLDDRVKSWRASTISKPTPLSATRKVSIEQIDMPDVLPVNDSLLISSDEELNLEDYTWSPSSAGPSDHGLIFPVSPARLPSIHIANRVEGSVCLTPSDCTSFGPSDYTLPSPRSSMYRLPSPDIAHRMYEYVPLTPSTATSWGPPLESPRSPVSISRALSIDLGERGVFSRPVTPSTATSWGSTSQPVLPLCSDSRSQPIHLGGRDEFSKPATPLTSATSCGPPLCSPAPLITPFHIRTDTGHRELQDPGTVVAPTPWGHSWPYFDAGYSRSSNTCRHHSSARSTIQPWGQSWPYIGDLSRHIPPIFRQHSRNASLETGGPLAVIASFVYPHMVLYQPAYPHFDLYPAVPLSRNFTAEPAAFSLAPSLPPDISSQTFGRPQLVTSKLAPSYPIFDIYPATYPSSIYEVYPPVSIVAKPTATVTYCYPYFDLYPAVDPYRQHHETITPHKGANLLNLDVCSPATRKSVMASNGSPSGYPEFNLYPLIDPAALSKATSNWLSPVNVQHHAKYPYLALYPGVYPYFDLYPIIWPTSNYEISHLRTRGAPSTEPTKPTTSSKNIAYPVLTHELTKDPKVETTTVVKSNPLKLKYPHFDLYPTVTGRQSCARKDRPIHGTWRYPMFDLYPVMYPFVEAYSSLPPSLYAPETKNRENLEIGVPSIGAFGTQTQFHHDRCIGYPKFNLYPAVYPYFDLYPNTYDLKTECKTTTEAVAVSVKIMAQYPVFDLCSSSYTFLEFIADDESDPAVYPHFNLWPSSDCPRITPPPSSSNGKSKSSNPARNNPVHSRLTHSELHAMVMMERIESSGSFGSLKSSITEVKLLEDMESMDDSGTTNGLDTYRSEFYKPTKSLSEELLARRRVPNLRPTSTNPGVPTESNGYLRLPQPSSSGPGSRLSSAFGKVPALGFEDVISPLRTLPKGQVVQSHQELGLGRSSSLMGTANQGSELNDKLSRPASFSAVSKPASKRRDSIVSQRIKAFNASHNSDQICMDTLLKFPAPPNPVVSRTSYMKLSDHLKYPCTRQ